jgi:hypothetical protein
MLVFFCFARGGEFYCFFITARQSDYFPNTGDISRRLCRHLSLSATQPSATRELRTSWATMRTRDFI